MRCTFFSNSWIANRLKFVSTTVSMDVSHCGHNKAVNFVALEPVFVKIELPISGESLTEITHPHSSSCPPPLPPSTGPALPPVDSLNQRHVGLPYYDFLHCIESSQLNFCLVPIHASTTTKRRPSEI